MDLNAQQVLALEEIFHALPITGTGPWTIFNHRQCDHGQFGASLRSSSLALEKCERSDVREVVIVYLKSCASLRVVYGMQCDLTMCLRF